VKLLEAPGLPPISIGDFLGKAVEAPLQQAVTSAIQVRAFCAAASGGALLGHCMAVLVLC
jgi:hypothetical protein